MTYVIIVLLLLELRLLLLWLGLELLGRGMSLLRRYHAFKLIQVNLVCLLLVIGANHVIVKFLYIR